MESNHEQLVKSLRHCIADPDGFIDCGGCPMFCKGIDCQNDIHNDAADAIEELQQIAAHYEQSAKDWWAEACEYKQQLPKQGDWKRVEDGETYHYECSECGERPLYSRYGDIVLSAVCPMCGANMEVQDGK